MWGGGGEEIFKFQGLKSREKVFAKVVHALAMNEWFVHSGP